LIGCGQQGRLLAAALRRVPDTQLSACSDPDPVALNAIPGARVARFADYRALLEASTIDAAIVATPHLFLADAAQAVAQAGRHVFCEKPLAASAERARSVVATAASTGVNLMVGYVQRFDPLRQRMKCLLDEGALGELAYVVALRLTGGLLVHLDCSQAAADVYDYIEAVGSAGRVRGEWRPNYRLAVQSRSIQGYKTPRGLGRAAQSLARACVAELTELAASIREARPPAVTGTDAVRVLEVLEAIALSAELSQPVTLDRAT
jgi:predicted dehydrogenase